MFLKCLRIGLFYISPSFIGICLSCWDPYHNNKINSQKRYNKEQLDGSSIISAITALVRDRINSTPRCNTNGFKLFDVICKHTIIPNISTHSPSLIKSLVELNKNLQCLMKKNRQVKSYQSRQITSASAWRKSIRSL